MNTTTDTSTTRSSTGTARNLRRRLASLVGATFVAGIVSVGALGAAGVAHAGNITPGGDYRMGSGLRCGTGTVGANLPVVSASASGTVFEITELLAWNGSSWTSVAWSGWHYSSIGAGSTNGGSWIDYSTGNLTSAESFNVTPGHYYVLRMWALVDGAWINDVPVTAGAGGIGVNIYCFA